jgi:general secretion pathway protein J
MKMAQHTINAVTRSSSGFTLIELLLAIGIMATILAAMSTILFVAFKLNNGVTDSVDQSMPVEQALNYIQRDLANVIGTTNTMLGTNGTAVSTNTMLIGPFQTINQTNVLPDQIGPDFYTTGGMPDGLVPWGDIEKVDYLLSPPTNRMMFGKDLVRAVTRNLLPVNPPGVPDQKRTVLSGVQSVVFMYYDGLQWDPTWDSTQQTNLPSAIKMDIQMAAQGKGSALGPKYELVIPLDVQVTTNYPTGALQ